MSRYSTPARRVGAQTVIVFIMTNGWARAVGSTSLLVLAVSMGLTACSSNDTDQSTPTTGATGAAAAGECPTAPVDVVVSVDQWGDIVSELGG